MAIQGVNPACYILALFIRDDGERFLLGSGFYEFKEKQMHFSANSIENDTISVQGNDGYLLAGQVRRPGSQDFNGFVGDGTVDKATTEQKRRDFFSFFRKNFFYKVVYVFPNGTAIQRKRGFLVDDPTVKELYQIYPEYHVALNFEDVNYYSYAEDDDGHEIYAKVAEISLTASAASGGLMWDTYGVVWENIDYTWSSAPGGTSFVILNQLDMRAKIKDLVIQGDTFQQTYSGKNLFNFSSILTVGCTYTENNGIYTITATANSPTLRFILEKIIPTGTYAVSGPATLPSGTSLSFRNANNGGVGTLGPSTYNTTGVITTTGDAYSISFFTNIQTGGTMTLDLSKFMVEVGSSRTSYEPYTAGPAPNPDYPQAVNVVTGTQTIAISDGTNTQNFTVDLGSTELCKIGTYQDYIYKSGDDWYVHKEIEDITLDGTQSIAISNWRASATSVGWVYAYNEFNSATIAANSVGAIVSNKLLAASFTSLFDKSLDIGIALYTNTDYGLAVRVKDPTLTTSSAVNTYLGSNPIDVYYPLATPTDTKITDSTLIDELNALGSLKLLVGENNVLVSSTGTNLPAPVQLKYVSAYSVTGAEWEEGGPSGPTTVSVDSIAQVFPVWEVRGPAVNPQLSVLTTGTTITYAGSITSSQTLVIDMFNKTATLNGTSVVGNVAGDWISFKPGTNRVVYTTGNADAQPSLIKWQEIVG